ncbi:MAG: Imm1 family immunity protein [Mycobacteriales bacterium]
MLMQAGQEQYSVDELPALRVALREASKDRRLCFLHGRSGRLGVGLGHPTHAVLTYLATSRPRPVHSVGDRTAGDADIQPPLIFSAFRFAARCAVPLATAEAAAEAFFVSGGELPDSVSWEPEPSMSSPEP